MKTSKAHLFLITILLFSLFSCSSDDISDPIITEPEPLAEEFHENLSYGTHAEQVYDLFLPAGRSAEKTKILVLVHGGFWTGGDKSDMVEYIGMIQESFPEYAIVNMNYVLATSSSPAFPNQFLDIDLLIDTLTSQQEDFQILPEFGLIGASSGAHLSLYYDYVYDTDDQVKMVCDVVGPTDFTDPFYTSQTGFENLMAFLVDESAYPAGTDYALELSPAFNVSSMSSPTILFYGTQDELIPTENAYALESALSDYGIPHSLTFYEGGHGDWAPADFEDFKSKLEIFVQLNFPIQ